MVVRGHDAPVSPSHQSSAPGLEPRARSEAPVTVQSLLPRGWGSIELPLCPDPADLGGTHHSSTTGVLGRVSPAVGGGASQPGLPKFWITFCSLRRPFSSLGTVGHLPGTWGRPRAWSGHREVTGQPRFSSWSAPYGCLASGRLSSNLEMCAHRHTCAHTRATRHTHTHMYTPDTHTHTLGLEQTLKLQAHA